MGKENLEGMLWGSIDGFLGQLSEKVNAAVQTVDLSKVKTPTIKTDNKISFNPVVVIAAIAAAWFLLRKMF